MKPENMTKEQLIQEVEHLHDRVTHLEASGYELKKAEEALRLNEQRLKALYKGIPMPTATWQKTGNDFILMDYNDANYKITQGKITDLVGKTARELYPDMPEIVKDLSECYDNKITKNRELEYRLRSTGEIKYMAFTYGYVPPDLVMLHAQDITKRKHAEEALRESKESAEKIIDSIKDGFSVLDNDGTHVNVNKALCKMTGYKREELIGTKPPFKYWPRMEYENIYTAFNKTLKKEFEDFELIFKHKNGEHFPCIVSPSCIEDEKGKVISYFATVKDITKRKRTEDELRKYTETQILLLREVNHRVKNNLSTIIGLLHKEANKAKAKGITSCIPILENLERRIHGLAAVHTMLSASAWQPISLSDLISQVSKAVTLSVPTRQKIDIHIRQSDIHVDSAQAHHLTLIINELVTNTIKHAAKDKETVDISVKMKNIGEDVEIRYNDNGPGFPQEMLKGHVRKTGGGLDLIRGIVMKNLKGKIRLMNKKGVNIIIQFRHSNTDANGRGLKNA